MGSCTFIYKNGLQCSCTSGSLIVQADCISTGGTCDDCGHLLSLHRDHVSLSRPSELSSSLSHPDISPRVDTVSKLAALLDGMRVLHVRGTPSSGKTTLAGLLERYYRQRGEPVVFMTGWYDVPDPREHLVRQCGAAGYHHISRDNFLDTNIVFILDEAQQSYCDYALWLGIIKSQSGRTWGPRMCLFASYGSPTSGPPEYPHGSTPVHLGPSQRVALTTSHIPGSPDVCLFYTEDEFQDVLNRLCSRPAMIFHMESAARAYLYSMTNGHPGAVEALVSHVFETYRSDLKKNIIQSVTKELLVNSLDDESCVFRRLEHSPVFRSFPSAKHLTVSAANVLRKVLQDGIVSCNLQDAGIKLCYEMGWLHSDHTEASSFQNPDVVCFLPSKLHEKFVEYYLHVYQPIPFPLDKFPSLTALCEAVLRRFSRKNLLLSLNARQIPSTFLRPPEAQFQDEWYRAFYSLVDYGVGISSEWSHAGDGRIDFRIIEPAWGVELLRDGDQLTQHCDRFRDNGIYHKWILGGLIRDWLILDCRHTHPKKYNIRDTKLWRVVFKENYTSAYILNYDNSLIVPEFPLLE